jgi:hypothetical protein
MADEVRVSPAMASPPVEGGGHLPRRSALSGASGALIAVLVLPSAAQASSPGGSVPTASGFVVDIDDDRDRAVVVSFYEG